jgi:hypothetical protein
MGNGYFADAAFQVHPNGHDYDAIGSSHGHKDSSSSAIAASAAAAPTTTSAGSESDRQGVVIDPPPKGDCSRKKINDRISVERVCGPERQHPDEIRVIKVIPSAIPIGS